MYADGCDKQSMDMLTSDIKERFELIAKALTPPTADEVCEALGKHLNRTVKIGTNMTFYYTEERQHYGECDEIICGYGWEWEYRTISFEIDLTPPLITLIGRFYQGVGK